MAARSTLNPDAAVHAVPLQVVRRAFEYGGLKAIGSLKFKVKERLERAQAMLFFRGNENHCAGADLAATGTPPRFDLVEVLRLIEEMPKPVVELL